MPCPAVTAWGFALPPARADRAAGAAAATAQTHGHWGDPPRLACWPTRRPFVRYWLLACEAFTPFVLYVIGCIVVQARTALLCSARLCTHASPSPRPRPSCVPPHPPSLPTRRGRRRRRGVDEVPPAFAFAQVLYSAENVLMTPLILLKKQEVSEEVTLRVRKAWLKRHIVYITDNMSATGDKQYNPRTPSLPPRPPPTVCASHLVSHALSRAPSHSSLHRMWSTVCPRTHTQPTRAAIRAESADRKGHWHLRSIAEG